jgi:polysaccharide pyruvyl transferase WcaK-like protein
MNIALLNVKFSPNLGDGLLAECLERELAVALPGAMVVSIDLAGRGHYRGHGPSRRGRVIALLEALPRWARRRAVRVALAVLVRFRLRGHVRARLAGIDVVVVGGGNLLSDTDLNFPMKLAGALGEVARAGLPVAVHAVGVNRRWSRAGHHLFVRALCAGPLITATVRDQRSQRAWRDLLEPHGVPTAGLAGDPGLLAVCHFDPPRRELAPGPGNDALVGLCITSPLAVRYHASGPPPSVDFAVWYHTAALALVAAGLRVVLFTNGSPEDRAFLGRHGAAWAAAPRDIRSPRRHPITIAPAFATPAELVSFIAGCDVIIAHRMHACIVAHSFAIPSVGLKWDVKLDSFFALAGRQAFIADCADLDPDELVALTRRALANGVDRAQLARLIATTRADIARLAMAISTGPNPVSVSKVPPTAPHPRPNRRQDTINGRLGRGCGAVGGTKSLVCKFRTSRSTPRSTP